MEYERKEKEELPVLAICYDFDKTLSPDDMQAQGYIQSVNYNIEDFWNKSNGIAKANDMDQNLAYMYTMVQEARGKLVFNKAKLMEYGSKVQLFPGVNNWFTRIDQYGREHNVIVEHYIISSGLKEMIEGTSIAKNGVFKKIYASSFYYDDYGVAVWPAQVINFTNKTQFLFRIEKGVLDINDSRVNDYFPPEKMRVPFRNMIYIGDSDTDIPCMKLVNTYGGHSIGVYDPEKKKKDKVRKLIKENRIRYFAPADYTEGSELDHLVKAIIDKTVAYEVLEAKHVQDLVDTREADNKAAANYAIDQVQKSEVHSSFEMLNNTEVMKAFLEELRDILSDSLNATDVDINHDGEWIDADWNDDFDEDPPTDDWNVDSEDDYWDDDKKDDVPY